MMQESHAWDLYSDMNKFVNNTKVPLYQNKMSTNFKNEKDIVKKLIYLKLSLSTTCMPAGFLMSACIVPPIRNWIQT
jgi:hypothetical protein